MSDSLSLYMKQSYDWKLKFNSEIDKKSCFAYLNDPQVSELFEVAFTVSIPYKALQIWHKFVHIKEESGGACDYLDLLNCTFPGDFWQISKVRGSRIERNLEIEAGRVKNIYSKCKGGRQRKVLDEKQLHMSIFTKELESISHLKQELEETRDQLNEWKEKFNDLESEKRNLLEELENLKEEKAESIEELENLNQELKAYICQLEKNTRSACTSKTVSQVGKKQRSRKLKQLKDRAHCALWFAESFGLNLDSIIFRDSTSTQDNGPRQYSFHYENKDSSQNDTLSQLTQDQHSKLEQILFLLDKFCVSDECYHELTLLFNDMPRSYLVKQRRSALNELCHIERVPGPYPGAQHSFSNILQHQVKEYLESNPAHDADTPVKIKISGDGAKFSRATNFFIISFSLLQTGNAVMSSSGNISVGVVAAPEEYETIRTSFTDLVDSINKEMKKGYTMIDDKKVPTEYFLGGDYKFLLSVMGLSGATSNFSCLWCKVHKLLRWDMSKPLDFYNSGELKRTLEELKMCCELPKSSKKKFCCVEPPLFEIDLDHIVLDELHLLLRITDRMMENLILKVMEKDSSLDRSKKSNEEKGIYLKRLIKAINDLGVPFSVWEKKNADNKGSGSYDWTSLAGSEKKKILKNLPGRLAELEVLHSETQDSVIKIWEDFLLVYRKVCKPEASKEDALQLHTDAKEWVQLFCSLGTKRLGYEKKRVTPYMHSLVYHIPKFMQNYGCLMQFTGQGDAKRTYFQKSNKWEAAQDILLLEHRQRVLRNQERVKRKYNKKKMKYWNDAITANRQKKRKHNESSESPQ